MRRLSSYSTISSGRGEEAGKEPSADEIVERNSFRQTDIVVYFMYMPLAYT